MSTRGKKEIKQEVMSDQDLDKVFDNEYYKIIKLLLINSGLWPFQSNFGKYARRLIIILSLCMILYPIGNGVKHYWSRDLILTLENFLGLTLLVGLIIKYIEPVVSAERYKNIYRELATNWLSITDPIECSIIRKYAQRGKIIAIFVVACNVTIAAGFIELPMLPKVLDKVYPLNESRNKIFIVRGKYPVDPDEYYFYIQLALVVNIIGLIHVSLGVDPVFLALIHHFMGITSVIRYRLFHATLQQNLLTDESYKIIVEAIRLHQKALEFIDMTLAVKSNVLFVHISFTTLIISLSCATASIAMDSPNFSDLFRCLSINLIIVMHAFGYSWCGQLIYDSSSNLFFSVKIRLLILKVGIMLKRRSKRPYLFHIVAMINDKINNFHDNLKKLYDNEWYNLPKRSKVLLQIMMMRCMKPHSLSAGGMTDINFYNFGVIIKSAISYMTVMVSFREQYVDAEAVQ